MKASQYRSRDDCALGVGLDPCIDVFGNLLVDSLVRPRLVEVIERVLAQDPTGMVLAENHDMIETLVAGATKESLHDGITVGGTRWNVHHLNARSLGHRGELWSVFAVVVAVQVTGSLSEGRDLSQLLGSPCIARRTRDVEMHDLTTAVFHEEQCKDGTKQEIVELKEIAGPDPIRVIGEESRPGLRTRLSGRPAR